MSVLILHVSQRVNKLELELERVTKYKKGTYHAGARRRLSDHGVAGACLADKKHVLGGCPVDLF